MKISPRIFFLLMMWSVQMKAGEINPGPAAPLPRVRLDPASLAAIPEPAKAARKGAPDAVMAMSPFIVKSTPLTAGPPEPERGHDGPFSLSKGGRIGGMAIGNIRI